jgi:diguanylate cyclase (GGDEF)-like protein
MDLLKKVRKLGMGTEDTSMLPAIRPLVDSANIDSLTVASFFFSVILAVLAVTSCFLGVIGSSHYLYVTSFMVCSVVYLLCKTVVLSYRHLILPLFYIQLAYAFVFSILLGNYTYPGMLAVTFNVLLIAIPLLIIDAPWRINLLLLAVTATFLYTSWRQKPPAVFHLDAVNGVSFFFLSVFVNTNLQIRHINDFYNRTIIKKQRDTDMLTGTLTKKAMEISIQKILALPGSRAAMMMVDIDNFKHINDTYGHAFGDYFIADTAKCLFSVCRSTDVIGRFGGDEFILFCPGIDTADLAAMKAKEILKSVKTFSARGMYREKITVSIGCTLVSRDGSSYADLFNQVDAALYQAKSSGRDTYCIYQGGSAVTAGRNV